ncbi:MAG: CHAT domain-containing protein [Cytophagales bacterium]|nr:CHAT domain-containing protein [Cytophagales bacterium]
MKSIQITLMSLLTIAFLFAGAGAFAQYDKSLDKADEAYIVGDYAKARKAIEHMQKTVNKKLGDKNPYMAISLLKEAKINLELGQLNDVNPTLDRAVEMSYEVNDTVSAEHGFMMMEAGEIMISYGNFRKAKSLIVRAEAAFKNSNNLIEDIKAELEVMKAQVLVGKGFNSAAIEVVNTQHDFYLSRAFLTDGKKKQQQQRKEDYAALLTVRAQAFANMGDVDEATNLFYENKNWIKENLKKSNILYAWNTFLDVDMMSKHGLSMDAQASDYEDAFNQARKKYETTHWMVLLMQENLMSALYRNENKGKFNLVEGMYKSAIREFDKNSTHRLARERMSLDFDLADQDIKKLEEGINSLLSNPAVPKVHNSRIELLKRAREAGLLSGKHKNTEGYELQILNIQAELLGDDTPEYHLTKTRLANYYIDYSDKIQEANTIYIDSFHGIVEKEVHVKHEDRLPIMNHLAAFYEQTDDYKKANKILEEALLSARAKYKIEDIAYAIELEKIGNLQIKMAEYDDATRNIEQSIQILGDIKTDLSKSILAGVLITEAKLLAVMGEYDDADRNLYKSEKLKRKGTLTLESAGLDAIDDAASLYISVGRYADADKLLTQSLREKQGQFSEKSRHLNSPLILSSKLRLVKGDYSEAENMAQRANNITVSIFGENSTKIVPSLLALAEVYTTIGDYDKAEKLLNRSIEIQINRFGKDHVDVGKSISQLALVKYYNGENIDVLQKQFNEAERIIGASLGSNNPTYAIVLKNMSVANISAGNYSIATSYLEQAEKIWAQKIGRRNNVNAATISVLKGEIFYRQKDYAQAESFFNNALRQYEKVFSDQHPEYVKVQAKLSKTYYMQGDWKRSQDQMEEVLRNYKKFIKDYFPALSEREKAKFWNTIKPNYEFYNTLITSKNRNSKYIGEMFNNALLTKALLLNSSIKIRQRIMSSNDEELIEMYNEWVSKKELLTAALSMGSEQLAENGINTSALVDELNSLEKEMSVRSEDFGQGLDNAVITWENVRDALKENEVAVEMVRFRYFYHDFTDSIMYAVLYIKGGKRSEPKMILLKNGEDLEHKYLKNFRNRMKYKLDDDISYEQFWKPIVDEVGAVTSVYLSPDGVYNQINLEALPTPDGRYVIDNSNIILLSNTKDLYLDQQSPSQSSTEANAMMFGNPTFYITTKAGVPLADSGITRSTAEVISDLPGTKHELEELQGLLSRKGWKVDSNTELKADEVAIKEISNPRVFHVATHGFFQANAKVASASDDLNEGSAYENPLLKTGLLLVGAGDILNESKFNYNSDNGILTAYEAMNLNLDKTDLVVLSACETGLGEIEAGEGVYGLQRAFLVAGARTIIMSLFKVSDEATQQLMVKFYRKWIETGNKRQSFIDAKKEIRNEFKDPIYWGPFIMIGLD